MSVLATRAHLPYPAVRALDRRGHRQVIVAASVGVLGVVALLVAFLIGRASLAERDETIGSLSSGSDRLYGDAAALERQVVGLGGVPVVRPEPVQGAPGTPGVPGRDGAAGRDGRDGVTPPCLSEPPQCKGADGAAGADGADGAPGEPGVDGQPGQDGQDGADGAPGAPGADGPACPPGFVPTETGGATAADGTRYSRSITCVDPSSAEQPPGGG